MQVFLRYDSSKCKRKCHLVTGVLAFILTVIGCARYGLQTAPELSIEPLVPVPAQSDQPMRVIDLIAERSTATSVANFRHSTASEGLAVTIHLPIIIGNSAEANEKHNAEHSERLSTSDVIDTMPIEPATGVEEMATGSALPAVQVTQTVTHALSKLLEQMIEVKLVESASITPNQSLLLAPPLSISSVPILVDTGTGAFESDVSAPETGVERTVQVPILMYHYVSSPPADADIYRADLSVTPNDFAGHLDRILDENYTTISLYDLWQHLVTGIELPPRPVILTFDDGYVDNFDNAFPLLVQRGMTATFFVVTDFVDQNRPGYVTWDMVREMYNAGMSIESHGINHFSLKNRQSDFLVFQALRSKETIAARIGVTPRFISYPAGEYDQLTIDIFQSAGYLAGVTTIQGATHNSNSLFELRRVRVRGTTSDSDLIQLMELDW